MWDNLWVWFMVINFFGLLYMSTSMPEKWERVLAFIGACISGWALGAWAGLW